MTLTNTLAWIGLGCVGAIALTLTILLGSYLLELIERSTMRWLPMFRILYQFYQSLPKSKFAYQSRYFLAIYDRKELRFTHVEALTSEYQNEDEHERARDEFRQRLRKKTEVSE
ncbi:hypothetical protein [Paenibacillus alvei]|uniref:hypothetical protein n=1 Tax=Paenibacillus alvei TaxID=44250 RepID=UPI0018CDF0B6|nr:hypothetical protein [Paenibacillus alvei]MBG9736449.1 hypothetical protein [Paenibacillus alvei]MBG9736479.1 hypothetical protein [Paenibacillus alvei]MBG9736521.1 hypothetical protein [Paenibacillus alvei]MBG9736590.1 hypothetical protein [Paenibacillus alvei]MBG9745574.1 hypothetical protein [Paenibacillus alvei]